MSEKKVSTPEEIIAAIRTLAAVDDDAVVGAAAMLAGIDGREFTEDELVAFNTMLHKDISFPCACIENVLLGRFDFVIKDGQVQYRLTDFGRSCVKHPEPPTGDAKGNKPP